MKMLPVTSVVNGIRAIHLPDDVDEWVAVRQADVDELHEQLEAYRSALNAVCNAQSYVVDAPDGHPSIIVRTADEALDEAVGTARTVLARYPDTASPSEAGPVGGRATPSVESLPGETTFQWLIERGQPEGLPSAMWLENSARHPATHKEWTTNAREAAMFPDRETAVRYIAAEYLDARAVEHGFMDEASSPAKRPT